MVLVEPENKPKIGGRILFFGVDSNAIVFNCRNGGTSGVIIHYESKKLIICIL